MAFDLSNYSEQDLKRLGELLKEYERLEDRRGRFPHNLIDRVLGTDSRRWFEIANEWADISGQSVGSLRDKSGSLLGWDEVKRELYHERDPKLDKCLEGQPFEVRSFMERFQPANEKESALYNYMVKTGHIDDVSLATIADSSLIHHLWNNHQDSQDYNIRKAIMENPRCSIYLMEQGLSDNDWEVRKAAIMRPELSQEACIKRAKREGNPMVKQALQERLGALYPTQPDPPVPLAAMQALAKTPDGRTVAVHAGAIPLEPRKPPLGARVQDAQVRHEAQLAAFQKDKDRGIVIGGKEETPFVPTGR